MEFDDDEYDENRIMPPPKSFNRMDEDWDDDGQFAMGFEDDYMEGEDMENMENMEPLLQWIVLLQISSSNGTGIHSRELGIPRN